jgi:hypothetical protein
MFNKNENKMKIKTICFTIILVLITLLSCNKYFDLLPPNKLVKDQFWKTKEEVEQVLLGAYSSFAQMDDKLFQYGEMRADMVNYLNTDANVTKIIESNIYSDNEFCKWSSFYQVIEYCNEVIKNGPDVRRKDGTFTEFHLNEILAEAYFLRSLSYFYLVRIFKDVPFVQEASWADNVDFYLPKTDGDTILNHVYADLKLYRAYATLNGVGSSVGRVSKGAFDALMADMALWQFRYEDCIKHVDDLELLNKYYLIPSDDWFTIFCPGKSLESIFEFTHITNIENNKMYDLTTNSGSSLKYVVSDLALKSFTNSDFPERIRGVNKSIDFGGTLIWKYIGARPDGINVRSGSIQKDCSWIVYRYADVLLMKAEALSQLEKFAEAKELILKIYHRAGFEGDINLSESTEAYEERILEDRKLELAFEGKRWFDLMRMGRRNNFRNKAKLVDILVQNIPAEQKRILSTKLINPLGWYMPIAKEELERNYNLDQNAYYK